MDLFSPMVFAVGIPAVIIAGISKGGFGSAVAFASASILALVLEPQVALGLMLPLLMLIDTASLPAYWRKWDWPASRVLLWGSVPGVLLGVAFWAVADADMIRLVIGGVALSFVVWQTVQALGWLKLGARFGPRTGIASGVGVGFTSFVSHAGGPIAAVYLLGQGLSKTTYQASTVLVFWAVNIAKAAFYAGMGVFTVQTLLMDLVLAPFALLGTWLGVKAHHLVPERLFFMITYVALTLTGAKLIWDALT